MRKSGSTAVRRPKSAIFSTINVHDAKFCNPVKLQSRTDKLGNLSKEMLAVLLTRQFWMIWRLGRVRIWHNQSSTKRRMETTTMITCENAWFLPRVINVFFNWTLKWGNLCSTRLSSGPKGMFFLWAEGSKLHGSPKIMWVWVKVVVFGPVPQWFHHF